MNPSFKIGFVSLFLFLLLTKIAFPQWSNDPNNNLIVGYGLDPHICSDSAGGCYITYDYHSTSYPRWLAVERLNKYGYKPWGINKRILGELPGQSKAQIVEDGEGGVIVSYEDRDENADWTARIKVQRVDGNGNFLWGPTGVKVTLDEINQGSQKIVNDGEGGAVVVWINTLAEYKVNRINSNGERMWGDSGIVAGVNGYYDPPRIIRASDGSYYLEVREFIYKINANGNIVRRDSVTLGYIVPDSEGGIVLSGRVWTGMIPKLVAQRKDSLGNNLWQEPYVEIADSLGLGSFRIGINESIINYAWLGTYNGRTDRPFFQAININGNLLHQSKILLSEDSSGTTIIGIVASFNHNTIISWSIAPVIDAIFAQMYDTIGNKLWNENGVIVAHPRMTNQQYTTDTRGGFIMSGLTNNFTIVAQQVSKDGNLGEVIPNNTFQLSVDIEDAWNLVSIPGLHPLNQNVLTWWSGKDPGADVFKYSSGYQPVTTAAPGEGYWMKHIGAQTYNTGDEWPAEGIQIVAHDPIAGLSGWNLIGGYENIATVSGITTNPPGLLIPPVYQYSTGYQTAATINPGYGYWVKLSEAGEIILPEAVTKGNGQAAEYFEAGWGRIIITDAKGRRYTLYAVNGEANLDNYELPPAPPQGMFDIRYSSGRIAEDLYSTMQGIDMSGVAYPLIIRVENMDMRIVDETEELVNVILKAGEEVIISDATIRKLMVSGELVLTVYSLEQNYPNPFNPSTTIEFSLPEASDVTLTIYNMLGQKITELVNTKLESGKYSYTWNAKDAATGMYVYELRTEKFVSVKKMILLK